MFMRTSHFIPFSDPDNFDLTYNFLLLHGIYAPVTGSVTVCNGGACIAQQTADAVRRETS
jgi:hypothetical protein